MRRATALEPTPNGWGHAVLIEAAALGWIRVDVLDDACPAAHKSLLKPCLLCRRHCGERSPPQLQQQRLSAGARHVGFVDPGDFL